MAKTQKLKAGDEAPDFTADDSTGSQFRIRDFREKKSLVLVFLRYAGCPLCQLSMSQLKNRYGEFERKDAEVAVFVQSPRETLEKEGMADTFPFKVIPDTEEKYYRLYGVGSGNLFGMINPAVISKGIKAALKGYFQGKMEGNTWQLPGDFVIGKDGSLKLARIGDNVGDNLSVDDLLSYV
jgi:peroxiredoxin